MPDFLYGSMTALKMNKGNIIMVNLTSVFTLMKILRIESTLPSSHNVGKPFLENENSTKSNTMVSVSTVQLSLNQEFLCT